MLYVLEQGPQEKAILEQCLRERRQFPAAIANAPELILGLELYYTAYLELQSSRQVGFSEGKISWHTVHDYAMKVGYTEEQHEDLQYYVVKLDTAYLDWKEKAKSKDPKSKQTPETRTRSRTPRRSRGE